MRGNFRNFKPNQPHGALFWNGGNGALNAEDFALRGQTFQQPAYSTNRFGLTFLSAPYIPKILTNDKHDFLFLTLSGTRNNSPFDQYGTVPTLAERGGDFSALTTPTGTPITIYNPANSGCTANGNTPGTPFLGNVVPSQCIVSQAGALLNYVPQPSLSGSTFNYQRLTSAETNTTQVGVRLMHTFGSNASGMNGIMRMARQFLGQGNPGITQSMHFNFNYSHSASDNLNLFPQLGGKNQSHQYAVQAGYSIGKGRLTDNLTLALEPNPLRAQQLLLQPHRRRLAARPQRPARLAAVVGPAQHHPQSVQRPQRAATALPDFRNHRPHRHADLEPRQAQRPLRR